MAYHCNTNGWMLIGLLLASPFTEAAVTVIYDNGNTHPLAPFLEVFESDITALAQMPRPAPRLGAADINALLPIRSPGLTPGTVTARQHAHPFARPFFLIGSDARSREWLARYRDRLKAIGAVGMLVQAETTKDLQAIANLAKGLPIMPASGGDIAVALGLKHYPVLVTAQGIEQ